VLKDDDNYYVKQPTSLSEGDHLVWKLNRAIYGLKRVPQYWFNTIIPILKKLSFEPFSFNTYLLKHEKKGILLLLYVDDLLISASTITDIHTIRDNLRKQYELKDLKEAKRYLGFNLIRNRANNTVFITQTTFTEAILKKYAAELINSKALTP